MKGYIKGFSQFLTESIDYDDDSLDMLFDLGLIGPTTDQVELLNEWVRRGSWKFDPKTGLINVDGSVLAYERGLTDFKGIRFGTVSNRFHCFGNQLTSLEGAPQWVGGDFDCSENKLKTLVGSPKKVGGDFICYGNNLTSLKGAPRTVNGYFDCTYNSLTSLDGAPKQIGEHLYCKGNSLKHIDELELPILIGGKLYK